jgi:hypothetical protein
VTCHNCVVECKKAGKRRDGLQRYRCAQCGKKEEPFLGRWSRSRSRPSDGAFLQYCPLHPCYASLPSPLAQAKMGQMSKRSSNRRELRVLGSFRNFAHRQEAVGSFRKSVSVYEISEIGLDTTRQIVEPGLHARASLGREGDGFHAGADALNVCFGCGEIEFYGFGQVHLGDDGDVGGVEDGRVFERFVFSFGDGKKHQAEIFAQVVR